MTAGEIRVGSRGSRLALVQAELVAKALAHQGHSTRIVVIETEGDRRAPDTAWGEGAFVAAIERALLAGTVDVAVHSAKDIPTDEDARLTIAAYLPRADARDALVVPADAPYRSLGDLPAGTRVGTDSPRRTGFVLALRPDLRVHPLHGNVDTRLRRLDAGQTDALVLACAGLDRLGLGGRIAERLAPEAVPPAPGQGALAVQVRRGDERTLAVVSGVDHHATRTAVEAERVFLAASGGGCRAPIGALADVDGEEMSIIGGAARTDGSSAVVGYRRGPAADGPRFARELARELATRMSPRPRWRVLVPRARAQSGPLVRALRDAGLDPVAIPTISVDLEPAGGDLDAALRRLGRYAFVVVTSANGARAVLEAAERVGASLGSARSAAIGTATRRILEEGGAGTPFQPTLSNGAALAAELPAKEGERVLLVRGDLAGSDLPDGLRARRVDVEEVVAYRTTEGPEASRELLRAALAQGAPDAVVLTSGSTLRGLVALARDRSDRAGDITAIPAVCIGPETAARAVDAGFRVLAVAPSADVGALASTTAAALDEAHRQEVP